MAVLGGDWTSDAPPLNVRPVAPYRKEDQPDRAADEHVDHAAAEHAPASTTCGSAAAIVEAMAHIGALLRCPPLQWLFGKQMFVAAVRLP